MEGFTEGVLAGRFGGRFWAEGDEDRVGVVNDGLNVDEEEEDEEEDEGKVSIEAGAEVEARVCRRA